MVQDRSYSVCLTCKPEAKYDCAYVALSDIRGNNRVIVLVAANSVPSKAGCV